MLKKTTVYIEESELSTLKALSLIRNQSVAELIRIGIKLVCKSIPKEKMKAFDVLTKTRKNVKKKGYSNKTIMNMALKAQREVRSERKKKKTYRS